MYTKANQTVYINNNNMNSETFEAKPFGSWSSIWCFLLLALDFGKLADNVKFVLVILSRFFF
jgi:hypothetical protein